MSEERKSHSAWPWLAAGLICIVIPYATSYFAMVQPSRPFIWSGLGPFPVLPDYSGKEILGRAARNQEFWEKVYLPIHWIDRRARPGIWKDDVRPGDP